MSIKLKVKRIKNCGVHGEYPALRNIETGRIYADTCLGVERFLTADADGFNRCAEFVGYNIPGCWHSWCGEPEAPLKHEVEFILVTP